MDWITVANQSVYSVCDRLSNNADVTTNGYPVGSLNTLATLVRSTRIHSISHEARRAPRLIVVRRTPGRIRSIGQPPCLVRVVEGEICIVLCFGEALMSSTPRSRQTSLQSTDINHAGTSDVNMDLGPKAKAKDLVPETTDPHQA